MASTRNTLCDEEVSIIKGLLESKRYSNQEIVGLINRARGSAELDVSTGRISNIKNDQIDKYRTVPAASQDKIQTFLDRLADQQPSTLSPTHPSRLAKLLPVRSLVPLVLDITETDIVECKKSLNLPMKTIAAFANNKGGYIVCGVENASWHVEGLQGGKIEKFDLNQLNQRIRDQLGIGLEITAAIHLIEGHKVGIFHVAPAHTKPVIFIQNGDGVSQGHIYYRYPGEDRLIAPADLQNIIENRIRQLSETILSKHISNILRFGLENSAVLNIATGEIDGKAGSFLIDENLLPKISFVKEGEFVEKSGAPTLRLVGNVAGTRAVITYSKQEIIELYPVTYKQLTAAVKKATGAKEGEIQHIIKRMKIKRNEEYSHFLFSTIEERDRFRDTGRVSNSTRSLYNETAVRKIISVLNDKNETILPTMGVPGCTTT